MKKLTAILIDDEISNLKGLENKVIKSFKNIEILRLFQKPEDAIEYLNKEQPDIVFLDIEMPRINGFELLSKIKDINFQVIFITAYSEYAIEAFKQNAVDYVLKPIDDDDLKIAIDKITDLINTKNNLENKTKLVQLLTDTISIPNKIIIPTSKGLSFVPEEEVIHLEGYEGYTKIHLLTETITSSYNLGKFEKGLSTHFFKCHKSHIINIQKVRHFENEGYLVLENKKRVPVSKAKRKEFINLFNK
jgi:two-component system LytT family response regulator